MQETTLMFEANDLFNELSRRLKETGDRRLVRPLELATRRRKRRMIVFVRRINEQREDEILLAEVIE